MMKLPLPRAHYEAAKRKGWIKTARELFPEMGKTASNSMRMWGQTVIKPDPLSEYWMVGAIAPCLIEIIN